MRIARVRTPDGPRAAWVEGEELAILDLPDTAALLADPFLRPPVAARIALDTAALLAPVTPHSILGVGRNYGPPSPRWPASFVRPLSCLAAPFAAVRARPEVSDTFDYEGELAVVMGAHATIAGFTIVNDFTLRAYAAPETLPLAKGLPGSLPCGPWVVTNDEISDPHALRLRTRVNGTTMQDSSTTGMSLRCDAIVAMFASVIALEPGDLICTGSPGGTGHTQDLPRYLRPADTVRVEIDGIGFIESRIL